MYRIISFLRHWFCFCCDYSEDDVYVPCTNVDKNNNDSNEKPQNLLYSAMCKNEIGRVLFAGNPTTDEDGNTALHYVALVQLVGHEKPRTIEMLVNRGINANARNLKGETPLHIACKMGKTGIVRQLLACEAINISLVDNGGNTVLDFLSESPTNKTEIITELINSGISTNAKDRTGRTAYQLSKEWGPLE